MEMLGVHEIEHKFKEGAQAQGINPGSLMQPLRVCLSGEAGGPPLFDMLKLIGVNDSAERIRKAVASISTPAA
jgi:glutamyl-tRNA synthetase